MKTAFIGLGSNLNNPEQQILHAIERLEAHPSLHHVVTSKLYYSRPLGPQDQPDYVNACARLQTSLSASLLLDLLQWLEWKANRVKTRPWGERSLDVDLLYYQHTCAERIWQSSRLILPHPQFAQRDFVLYPLREVIDDSWPIDIETLCSQLSDNYIRDHYQQ